MKKLLFALISIAILSVAPAFGQALDYDKLAPHPRLLLKNGDVTAMKEYVAQSANAKTVHNFIISEADKMLDMAPVERSCICKVTGNDIGRKKKGCHVGPCHFYQEV